MSRGRTRAQNPTGQSVHYPTHVPLTVAGFNTLNTTSWTLSNPTATTLRATYAGAATTTWDSGAADAMIVLWPVLLVKAADTHLKRSVYAALTFTQPTANGIGVGIGYGQHVTNPSQGAYAMADRVDATNVRVQLNGEAAAAAVLSASIANTFGLALKGQTVKANRGDFNGGLYTPPMDTTGFHDDDLVGEKGGGISGMGGGDNMYMAMVFFAGGAAGYVDVTALAYHAPDFQWTGGL